MEVITTHLNADFDTLASMIAAKKIYPHAKVVFPGGTEKGVTTFLKEHPLPGLTFTKSKEIELDAVKRLIIVDTRQMNRIGIFSQLIGNKGVEIHIYDHHPPSKEDIKGDLSVISAAGSTTTLLTEILKEKDMVISPEEATAMMLGIYEDTGSLTFISTTVRDYHAAAHLLSNGADLKIVSNMIRAEMSAAEVALLNDLNSNRTTHRIKNVDAVITQASSEKYIRDAAALVHKLMEMNHEEILFALIRMENKVYLIARSARKEVDAGEVARCFGGGGHPTAGSATIKEMTLIEAESRLFEYLEKAVHPIRRAGHIMSSPVKTIDSHQSLKYAKDLMAKLNLDVMPVLDGEALRGIIFRQDLGKAIFHGLEESEVGEFMITDHAIVDEDTPLAQVQEIIIEENQKFLPVMRGSRLVGCITRTDVLRILHHESRPPEALMARETHGKSLKGLMKGRIPARLQEIIERAGALADQMSINAYLVGGFVRDLLLGRENLDIDIVVEGDGITFAESLSQHYSARVRSHRKFGTAVMILPDGFKIDIASARMEFYSTPAALPTVEAGPIKMDLYRRDFTINSMAIRLNSRGMGELIDYFGGLRDLREKALRVLHSLSFIEDPTRAIRAARFEKRFGFQMGKHSLSLVKNAARLDFFDKVSPSRIFSELKIILMGEKPLETLIRLRELDIIRFIHPKFRVDEHFSRLCDEQEKVFDWYDLLFKKESCEKWLIYLALLQKPLTLREVKAMAARVGLAAKRRDKTCEIKSLGEKTMKKLERQRLDNCALYHLLIPLKIETLLFVMALSGNRRVKERISLFITQLQDFTIDTTGQELKAMGLPPGPLYGEIKARLIDERLKGTIDSKEEELSFIRERWLPLPGK